MYYFKGEVDQLITAALDQRRPSPKLVAALNAILDRTHHPCRVRESGQFGPFRVRDTGDIILVNEKTGDVTVIGRDKPDKDKGNGVTGQTGPIS